MMEIEKDLLKGENAKALFCLRPPLSWTLPLFSLNFTNAQHVATACGTHVPRHRGVSTVLVAYSSSLPAALTKLLWL